MTVIALLPGDGIGPEVIEGPVDYLRQLAAAGLGVELTEPLPYGTTGWQRTGSVLPLETVDACRSADVIFSGAVGTHPGVSAAECPQPEAALIQLRHLFDLRVSVRTVWMPAGGHVTIVRNIVGGAYAEARHRQESDGVSDAVDEIRLHPDRVREVLELAAGYARLSPDRRSISVDKAAVLATSRLWRRLATEVCAEFGVGLDNVNVDRAAFELAKFDDLPAVIATEGLFGDILSDLVCARAGSPALCGSATINPTRSTGMSSALFEPAHGTSPHRTGTRTSNPTGAWLALAQLFDWCGDLAPLGLAEQVRRALETVIAAGARTYDVVGPGDAAVSMDDFNQQVMGELKPR